MAVYGTTTVTDAAQTDSMPGKRLARQRVLYAMLVSVLLAACDRQVEEPDPTPAATEIAKGFFRDSATSGLGYRSEHLSGITDGNGQFEYVVGKPVEFHVGGVSLGSANGSSLITPVDLVPDGSSTSPAVRNITRFLLMLDADGDAQNGIAISDAVRKRAESWKQIDFSTADLPAALQEIIADARAADGGIHYLPDGASARSHLEVSFLCAYSGAFRGNLLPDGSTRAAAVVAPTGMVFISALDTNGDGFEARSNEPLTVDQKRSFTAVGTQGTASIIGRVSTVDEVSGTLSRGGQSTTFTLKRLPVQLGADFRFSGFYADPSNLDAGIFSLTIDRQEQVAGIAYSLYRDQIVEFAGEVSGLSLTAKTSSGITISATLYRALGLIDGTWAGSGTPGSFDGMGCRLH